MLELWIDGQRCDIESLPTIPIDFSLEQLTQVDGFRSGRKIELELPTTPRNDAIFGSSRDLYTSLHFNAGHHIAEVKRDDVIIFKGTTYLLATTLKDGFNGGYKIAINEGGAEWIEAVAKGDISDLEIPFSGRLDLTTIANSWEGEQAVRFLPVQRGEGQPKYSADSIIKAERVMLTDDYHPFISIAEMVKAMFANSGYKVRSNFLESELGQSLYMSGDYARSSTEQAKAKCDFFARRSTPVSATADFMGRVYASAAFAAHSVGPIVDTANPESFDSDGVQMVECFNTLNAFSKSSSGDICFTPRSSVKAGFMLHLEYTTDYKILSREQFVGFDMVEGLSGVRVEFPFANTCIDYRNNLSKSKQYRLIVFDHTTGNEYKLMTTYDSTTATLANWSTRSLLVTTPSRNFGQMYILYRNGNSDWEFYTGDWAMYAGYIEESGRMDVEMDFRIPPQEVNYGEEYLLDKIWFGGAEQGMTLTIGIGTTLRPYFSTVPGYGSQLEFVDIAPRQTSQMKLLTALGEMFNLAFYTDRQSKEVFIEPLEELYSPDTAIDWSCRIDHLNGIVISDTGVGKPQNLRLTYIESDKATHAFNLENNTLFGCCTLENPLYGTTESTRELGNTLFTTTLNISEVIGSAPSASLLQVGDIGNADEGIDTPFTPRIVCYKGMRQLPEGEWWIVNKRLDSYPYAAFSDDESINLCFEERGGVEGLSRYYASEFARQCKSQNITLDLYLTTAEMATLFTTDGALPSLRRRFRFNIQGESSQFRLAEVKKWDSSNGIVRCTFERELND